MPTRFRLDTSQIFLTYPRCDLDQESIFNHLLKLNYGSQLQRILVAREVHEDGGFHIHAYLRAGAKVRVRSERFFDISNFHPNIQGCRSPNAVLCYCKKDGSYISRQWNGKEWDVWQQKIRITYSDALKDSKSFEEFMGKIREASPRDFVLSYDRIAGFGARHFKEETKEYVPRHSSSLWMGVRQLVDWKADNLDGRPDRPMSLLLVSPSRYGKTEWARSLGLHFYMCGMFNLDDFNPYASYGVFDDFNIDSIKYSYKQWFGCQKQFSLTDKYKKKCTVVWGKPCIFLMNNPVFDELKDTLDYQWILCNSVIVCLTNKLY